MAAKWTIDRVTYTVNGSKGTNQISHIHWRCTDTETVNGKLNEAVASGTVRCPDPSGSFIEYGKVTESNCLSWAKSLLGDTKVKQYEDEVALKLTLLKTPITGVGKPWA